MTLCTDLTGRPTLIAGLVLAVGLAQALVPSTIFGQSTAGEIEPGPTWPPMLIADREVRIRPADGRGATGRLVRIDDQYVIISYRPRLFQPFRKPRELTFDRDRIRTIDLVDSTWNGAAIGAAGAIAFTAIAIHNECTRPCIDNFGKPGRWVIGTLGLVLPAASAGALIDAALNRRIYEARPGRSARLVPVLGGSRIGVVAAVTF